MTFALAARCPHTGMLGSAVATSSLAVGSRCVFARAGVGAVLTQHRTDPRLGPLGLEYLAGGKSAQQTIDALAGSTPHHGWRQLAVVDKEGRTAHFSGTLITSIHGGATGDGVVAVGNLLKVKEIPDAMLRDFEQRPERPLAERLVGALAAGLAAGGENEPVRSAALLVVHEQSFPYVDLRVDDDAAPIGRLVALWQAYAPEADDFVQRAIAPGEAPGFASETA
ncbi:MAG TPA: DUF1028 domain-containing protein [Stellaceae bacterium]|jgi:uncharacterized Ntn-hydrolase superfamily protein|nr:DUF1028 domain-containing protein [Stellaceae bacterium]